MDQHQVKVVGFQLVQGFVDGCLCLFITGVGHPDLAGEEQFLSGYATFLDSIAYRFLVSVGLSGINRATEIASSTQRSHSSFETWKTPYPSFGILTLLFNNTYSIIDNFLSVVSQHFSRHCLDNLLFLILL